MSRNSKRVNVIRNRVTATVLRAASRGREATPKAHYLMTDACTERMEATMAKSHGDRQIAEAHDAETNHE